MRLATWQLMLAAMLFCGPAFGQKESTIPAAFAVSDMHVDKHAALIEIVPPASMQQSPAAIDLIGRLMRKHMLLLQHPALIAQTLRNPDVAKLVVGKEPDELAKAIRVRVVPDSNLIELVVDPAVAGEHASAFAEALVNQHLQNQQQIAENVTLERSVMLNNLKQRYQFRKDEIGRDMREKAVKLSIDGMGTPGRLSAKELELANLLQTSFALERKKTDTPPDAATTINVQLKQVHERIDAAKKELGELTNAMNQYLTLKDDESATRDLLKDINNQLDQISQHMTRTDPEIGWLCQPSRG